MTTELPTRLYKIKKGEEFGTLVKGVDLEKVHPVPKYCAISHVWGTKPPSFDIPGIPWKVPVTSKEKVTYIVKACAEKYEYMWMDILCINQDQTPEARLEMKKEMTKMKQYYGKSDATFVVGQNYQTFADRWSKVDALLSVWEQDSDGVKSETRYKVWQGLGDIDKAVGSAADVGDQWFWRVWTLQETILPPRLLTATGTLMRVQSLCKLIDWTYVALGKGVLNEKSGPARYDWIFPGSGVVNNHGWWMLSESLGLAYTLGTNLHPLAALIVTAYRNVSASHPEDVLFGTYGLMDRKWQFEDAHTLEEAWKKTVAVYINDGDLAPLLAMSVTAKEQRTWAAGKVEYIGSVVPQVNTWKNSTVKLSGDKLELQASGVSRIKVAPTSHTAYGDGSGELDRLFRDLVTLNKFHDISSIVALLKQAVMHAKVPLKGDEDLESLRAAIEGHENAVSSGLRAVFSGWNRWVVVTDTPAQAFLAWFPIHSADPKAQLDKCSLLWCLDGANDWAVVVDGESTACKKVGIAFANGLKVLKPTKLNATVV